MMPFIEKLRHTVLSKMMLRSIIVLSVSFLLVEYLAYRQGAEQIVALTEERQRELTALYAERFDQIIEAVEIDMRSIASLPSLRDYHLNRQYDLQAEARQQLGNVAGFLARLYERNKAYSEISIYDGRGQVHLTVNEGETIRHSVKSVDYFAKPLGKAERGLMTAGFADEGIKGATEEKAPQLVYSYPLTVQGEPIGRVSISYDFNKLMERLRKETLFETGHLAVYTKNARVVFTPDLPMGEQLESARPELWKTLASMPLPGTGRFESALGRGFLISATPMRAKPWFIAAIAPEREMFADLNRSRNLIVGLVALAILLELFAVFIFTRHLISQPVGKLLDGTRAVHAGDLGHRVEIDSNDEFGELAESFNHMTQSLKDGIGELETEIARRAKAEQELREAHDGLEVRIAERTDDLQKEVIQRSAAQKALRESEERFRDFTEISSDWVWELGPDFKVRYVSDRSREILGIPADEVFGRDGHEGADPQEGWEKIRQGLKERREFKDFEYRYNHPDGKVRYLRVSGKPIFDESGAFAGYRGSGTDESDRVKAQDGIKEAKIEAEHANEAKSEFLAKMSHELRTPLNAVIGYSDAMREGIFGKIENKKYQEYLTHIHSSGSHLLGLIDEILDLSKIEAGRVELNPETFNISVFVADALSTMMPMAKRRGNRLSMDSSVEIGWMTADRFRLNQILFNLLSNACKFTEEGEIRIVVEAEEDDALVAFKVIDTGIGIPDEKMGDLFEEFTQVHPEMVRSYGGTGLGLSISKNLCEMMGGSIAVESKSGEGSTFTVRIPRGEN